MAPATIFLTNLWIFIWINQPLIIVYDKRLCCWIWDISSDNPKWNVFYFHHITSLSVQLYKPKAGLNIYIYIYILAYWTSKTFIWMSIPSRYSKYFRTYLGFTLLFIFWCSASEITLSQAILHFSICLPSIGSSCILNLPCMTMVNSSSP